MEPEVKVEVKEPVKEEVIKEEVKSAEDSKFTVQLEDGNMWEVGANDYIMLATLGANTLSKKRKETEQKKSIKKEDDDSSENEEDEISILKARLDKFEKTSEADKMMNEINVELKHATSKIERLSGNEKLTNIISAIALSQHQQNPRNSLTKLVEHANKILEDVIQEEVTKEKNKFKNNKFLSNITNQTSRGGSASTVETGKKFTPDDVRKGASRRSMQEFLQKSFGE